MIQLTDPLQNDPVMFKKLLDIGATTLLVPYVSTVAEAEQAVRAVRYPNGDESNGIRGVAGSTRASRYGRDKQYTRTASQRICLLLQIETQEGDSAPPPRSSRSSFLGWRITFRYHG
jgi:4-hydroxy-2-oxoheptanedioate aldolase